MIGKAEDTFMRDMMTPRQHLDEIVRPNLSDFLKSPDDLRLALNAAVSIYHVADYVAVSEETEQSKVAHRLSQSIPAFAVIGDIATAAKHCKVTRGRRAGVSVSDVGGGRGAAFSDGTYYSDGTSHSDAPTVVRFVRNGRTYDLTHLLPDTLEALERELG